MLFMDRSTEPGIFKSDRRHSIVMSFYDVGKSSHKYENRGRLPGMFIIALGTAFITWFVGDLLLVPDARAPYLTEAMSLARLVLGTVFLFVGMIIHRWDEMGTIRP